MQSQQNNFFQCQIHNKQSITLVCIHSNCQMRMLCSYCKSGHLKTHTSSFIPIRDFFSADYNVKLKTGHEVATQNQKIYQDKLLLIEAIVTEIRARFEYNLGEFRNSLLKELSQYDSKMNSNWDLLNAQFEQIKQKVSKPWEIVNSNVFHTQNEFVDVCLDIDQKLSQLKIERGIVENFINYSHKNMERFTNTSTLYSIKWI